jgi:hypothetical protein
MHKNRGLFMRAFAFAIVVAVLAHVGAYGQEDVLRPNGRGGVAATAESPAATFDRPRESGPGLVLRGGIEGGLGLNVFQRTIEGILTTSPLGLLSSGTGISPMYGVYAEIELSPTVSLGLRMMVDHKSVSGSKSGLLQDCETFDPYGNSTFSVVTMSGEFTQSLTFFTFTPVVRVDLMDNFFAQVGPTIHLPTQNSQVTTTLTIDPTEQCSFNFGQPNESKVSTVSAEDDNIPALRLGLDAAVGYRYAIADGLELVPRIGYQLMITSFDNESSGTDFTRANTDPPARDYIARPATLSSLQASIALWFRL